MSASGKTKNYSLPIFNDNDATSWGEFNKAMSKIDENLKKVAIVSDSANEKTDTNTHAISEFNDIVSNMKTKVDNNNTLVKNLNESVELLETHDTEQDTRLNNIESQITTINKTNTTQTSNITSLQNAINRKMGFNYWNSLANDNLTNFNFTESNYFNITQKSIRVMSIQEPEYPGDKITGVSINVEFTYNGDTNRDFSIECDNFETLFDSNNGDCRGLALTGVIVDSTGNIEALAYGYICRSYSEYLGNTNKKIAIKISTELEHKPEETRRLILNCGSVESAL